MLRYAAAALLVLPAFTFLSDSLSVNGPVELRSAEQTFDHGHLEAAQRAAESGFRKFFYSQPLVARKFQLLLATTMLWRGLYEDALTILADERIPWADGNDLIQRSSLRANALTSLHRLDEAEQTLETVTRRCDTSYSTQCGSVLRAKGLLFVQRGQTEQAGQMFSASLDFARADGDGALETTALQNLGHIASLKEHHDAALEFYRLSAIRARELGALNLQQRALGNEGWEQYKLGNLEKALEMFSSAEDSAATVGDVGYQALWLNTSALVYSDLDQPKLAEEADLHALKLAERIHKKQIVMDVSMDLAKLYLRLGRPEEADRYAAAASSMANGTGNPVDLRNCDLLAGKAAFSRGDHARAVMLLRKVSDSPDSQTSMKWQAQQTLGRVYDGQSNFDLAEQAYKAALALVEGARADLNQEVSQLTFLENASSIYDDYIYLLVREGKTEQALEAADWSRARTLEQGLGSGVQTGATRHSSPVLFSAGPSLHPVEVARKAKSDLLFYWLGEKQSYLWFVTPNAMHFFKLPPRSELEPVIERYGKSILGLKDPLRQGGGEASTDAASLYRILVGPVAPSVSKDRPVVLLAEGALGKLNFESLVAPAPIRHFWLEDATILSALSIRMLAASTRSPKGSSKERNNMLLLGDAVPVADFPGLPLAALEMEKVRAHFPGSATVLHGAMATPAAYLASHPEQFGLIHFVTHGTASRTDVLDSAVILSRDSLSSNRTPEDGYKLYAREIVTHPLTARLVTLSACNSSGSKTVAGEGMVGLSWAFLRAGAHNAIGSLWEVSDASTPVLMDSLYAGLQRGEAPASALRAAKLNLIHSNGQFSRPFYWAPFQLYSGR